MNFGKSILFGAMLVLSFTTSAQKLKNKCDSLLFAATDSLMNNNSKAATTYFIKAESICNELHEVQWGRLLASAIIAMEEEAPQSDNQKRYIDTILSAFDRMESAGFYDEKSDLVRATYIMQSTEPDVPKADVYFQRGIKSQGIKAHEAYIVYAYYTTYLLFSKAEAEEKAALKKRMISDYMKYSKLIADGGRSKLTQEQLNTYLDYVISSCDDILPEIQDFIDSLPEEKAAAINMIQGMTLLLENKQCENSPEYNTLIDTWLKLDSNSMHVYLKQQARMKLQDSYDYPPPMPPMRKTDDPKVKAKLQYEIAYIQFNAGKYQEAYLSGKECTGDYKEKGLLIAAQCVAVLALSCGDTTFERKCNYLYAAQLAEEAGSPDSAEYYRAKGPSSDCSSENKTSILLDCWGVTVYTCR